MQACMNMCMSEYMCIEFACVLLYMYMGSKYDPLKNVFTFNKPNDFSFVRGEYGK